MGAQSFFLIDAIAITSFAMAIEKFEQIAFSLNPFRLRKFSFLWLSQGYHISEVIEIWRILKVLDCKYFGLAIWRISGNFLKGFGFKFFGLAKRTTCIFARICLHIHMYRLLF